MCTSCWVGPVCDTTVDPGYGRDLYPDTPGVIHFLQTEVGKETRKSSGTGVVPGPGPHCLISIVSPDTEGDLTLGPDRDYGENHPSTRPPQPFPILDRK